MKRVKETVCIGFEVFSTRSVKHLSHSVARYSTGATPVFNLRAEAREHSAARVLEVHEQVRRPCSRMRSRALRERAEMSARKILSTVEAGPTMPTFNEVSTIFLGTAGINASQLPIDLVFSKR
ncbi:hypothetical protein NDU88_004355 [Pleurodeles waltl]|uniref:Uncharacterized protein n=1 Tax=Pleurodeles waltl TaxID=8319 RepID=A0AAV7W850_PLEWA|nr:hypothetical protein NDU88_004355 [Pleurodeles waltl]